MKTTTFGSMNFGSFFFTTEGNSRRGFYKIDDTRALDIAVHEFHTINGSLPVLQASVEETEERMQRAGLAYYVAGATAGQIPVITEDL